MKKSLVILVFLIYSLSGFCQQQKSQVDKALTIFSDVLRQLDINYVDTLNYEDLIQTAITHMLQKVDPYTVYLPKEKDETIKMMTLGKYGGIGAVIQTRELKNPKGDKRRVTMVINPYEGKPAQRNGIRAGDIIVAIDGKKMEGKDINEVSNTLRGVPSTPIRLEIERKGEKKHRIVQFNREDIKIDPVDFACILDTTIGGKNVHTGYIRFTEFTQGSSYEFLDTLKSLMRRKPLDNLIIDLRGNGGGILDEAVKIVGFFVDKNKEVVAVKGKMKGVSNSFRTTNDVLFPTLPLMIMVDNNSASAAEILSGALQDFKRAKLIGDRTFGKGLVQNIRPIAYDGHLKVTTAKYYLPSGRCIQAIDYAERQKGKELKKDTAGGIMPDIVTTDTAKFDITYDLYVENMFFDYATDYFMQHPTIAQPTRFEITEDEIDHFCNYLDSVGFKYENRTNKLYEDMLNMAKMDDIDSTTLQQIIELQQQLKPSLRTAIKRNLSEVKDYLGAEIVQRYYYQKGKMAYMIRFDKAIKRAFNEINKQK